MKCGLNIQCVSTFLAGFVFSIGLFISGMTQPSKVISFLDIAGNWDPSLALVMAGAVSVYFTFSRLILKRDKPVFAPSFALPTRLDIDGRLLTGAALFGTGWGMVGYCPGPALATVVTFNPAVIIFVVAMTLGMYVYGTLDTRYTAEPDGGAGAMETPAVSARGPASATKSAGAMEVVTTSAIESAITTEPA